MNNLFPVSVGIIRINDGTEVHIQNVIKITFEFKWVLGISSPY